MYKATEDEGSMEKGGAAAGKSGSRRVPNSDDQLVMPSFEEATTELLKAEDSWADCLSVGSDALLDLDLDRDFDWDVSQGMDQGTTSPSEGLLEQTPTIGTEKETQPIPDPVLVTSAPPEVEGQISLPEVDSIDTAGLPVFTPEDMSTELGTLTDPELTDIISDLHGITTGIQNLQVDELKAASRPTVLSRLEDEVYKLPVERKLAYCQAIIKCPGLLSDERKMAFLERENGDPVLAAARLALYWELRLDLFGHEKCFLPMTLNGAMKDEVVNMVRWPIHQLLPVKDTAGRAIWYAEPSRRDFAYYSVDQELMQLWYLFEVAMEDPETLKHGIVVIANGKGVENKHMSQKDKRFQPPSQRGFFIVEQAMPIHLRALHFCNTSFFFHYLLPIFLPMYGRKIRHRLKFHRGSGAVMLPALRKFCLPRDRVPTELGGEVVLNMPKFLGERMTVESSRPDPRLVVDQNPIVAPSGPAAKRPRTQKVVSPEPGMEEATPPAASKRGRRDPRMDRAVDIRLANPNLSLKDVLLKAGYTFDFTDEVGEPMGPDQVTLTQKKNNLNRRLRLLKSRRDAQGASGPGHSITTPSSSSPVLEPSMGFFR